MTDKKLTDKEIKKAYEDCQAPDSDCMECPLRFEGCHRLILDYINRLEAENERLNSCVKTEEEVRAIAKETISSQMYLIKAAERKKFAEMVLKEIQEAILSNDKAISERVERHNANRYEDDLCIMCDGKIMALGGIRHFVFNLLKEMESEEK